MMERLEWICKHWLDNADLYEFIFFQKGDLRMSFEVGSGAEDRIWIDIECKGIHHVSVSKDYKENIDEGIFVGGVKVTKHTDPAAVKSVLTSQGWTWGEGSDIRQLYEVEVEGSIEIKVICNELLYAERHYFKG